MHPFEICVVTVRYDGHTARVTAGPSSTLQLPIPLPTSPNASQVVPAPCFCRLSGSGQVFIVCLSHMPWCSSPRAVHWSSSSRSPLAARDRSCLCAQCPPVLAELCPVSLPSEPIPSQPVPAPARLCLSVSSIQHQSLCGSGEVFLACLSHMPGECEPDHGTLRNVIRGFTLV